MVRSACIGYNVYKRGRPPANTRAREAVPQTQRTGHSKHCLALACNRISWRWRCTVPRGRLPQVCEAAGKACKPVQNQGTLAKADMQFAGQDNQGHGTIHRGSGLPCKNRLSFHTYQQVYTHPPGSSTQKLNEQHTKRAPQQQQLPDFQLQACLRLKTFELTGQKRCEADMFPQNSQKLVNFFCQKQIPDNQVRAK
eukprot:1159447-Pelagomonas_calceolata.AAC.4